MPILYECKCKYKCKAGVSGVNSRSKSRNKNSLTPEGDLLPLKKDENGSKEQYIIEYSIVCEYDT